MTRLLTNGKRSNHFDIRHFHRTMAAGIFDDQKVDLVAGKIDRQRERPDRGRRSGRSEGLATLR
jgi:hypothetical protein